MIGSYLVMYLLKYRYFFLRLVISYSKNVHSTDVNGKSKCLISSINAKYQIP